MIKSKKNLYITIILIGMFSVVAAEIRLDNIDSIKNWSIIQKKVIQIIKTLVKNDVPVMGHLGVLPQTAKNFKFKGKETAERKVILRDSKLLEEAGVFSIVLECVESSLAKEVTKTINIPTIGIGASAYCDGQVLVTDDLIGLNKIKARFVKRYSNIEKQINDAVLKFKKDVVTNKFPTKKHSY